MVSERSRLPASRPGTQSRAGRQNTRNDKDLNRSRPRTFPDRGGNAQTQQRWDFPGFPVSPLYSNGWPGTETMPQPDDTGPSWPKSHAGGASALPLHRPFAVCTLLAGGYHR